jgi:DNA-binding transcriptional regulator LsrR (DeoR family)
MAKDSQTAKETEDLLSEMRALKMLMILQLLRQGVKQSQIAAMLGVSEATMSRMLPKGAAFAAKGAA